MKLSQHGQSALNRVREKHSAYRIARETIMAELMTDLETRLESYVNDRDIAVKLADEAGVPRTQIGKAMGTTNYRTVQDILERAGGLSVASEQVSGDNWTVTAEQEGWRLTISDFGSASVSGSAVVLSDNGELVFVSGDEFVIPQVIRNGVVAEVINAIGG